jgi:hypothetical protein
MKVQCDAADTAEQRAHQPLPLFVYDYYVQLFGIRELAEVCVCVFVCVCVCMCVCVCVCVCVRAAGHARALARAHRTSFMNTPLPDASADGAA